jgi:polyhydroxybutyrate depolymerase
MLSSRLLHNLPLATLALLPAACASEAANNSAPPASSTTASTTSATSSAVNSQTGASSNPSSTANTSSNSSTTSAPTSSSSTSSSSATSTPSASSETQGADETSGASQQTHEVSDETTASGSTAELSSEQTAPGDVSSESDNGGSPSAGCGKSGRPNGGKVYVAGEYWLTFPSSYDGTKPFPLLFGFHGCGDGNRGDGTRTEYTDLTTNNVLGQDYVVAAPVSSDNGGCWNYNTDVVRAKALYDEIVSNYCVDTQRAFATGHSSGAQFVVQLYQGNHSADAAHFNFRGVAPVAASAYNHSESVAVMYIQNQNDTVRGGSGKDVVDDFVAANQCANTSAPYAGVDTCQSGGTVDPGCVQYDSCSVPTVWCSHNDPQYSNTGHGVPCFAAQAMDHFFKNL